ncbi:hypothetical protein E4T47_01706 [Aureobasidium subglaciale]|nr:hypothetical protein E4T47_01706 [Aureobasidium subglaciale]
MPRTRSQSREPSAEPQLVYRQATARDGQSIRDTRQPQRQLEPLSEGLSEAEDDNDIDVDSEHQEAASEEEDISDSDSVPLDTFSQTELKQLDPDEMENKLGELNSKAGLLLRCFKPRTGGSAELHHLTRQFKDPQSRERQKADGCYNSLKETQQYFTRGGEFLRPEMILRCLLRKKGTQPLPKAYRPWRPDDVIYKANLAVLAYTATQPADNELLDAQMSLDQLFPSLSMRGLAKAGLKPMPGHSALVSETFKFALELRTQVLVGMLKDSTSQDTAATMILQAMLEFDENDDAFEEDMSAMQSLQTALSDNRHAKGWEGLDPHSFGTDKYAEMIMRRTHEIKRLLFSDIENPFVDSSASLESGLIRLRKNYPLEMFQENLLQWCNLRLSEIDNSIKQLGGIDEIFNNLEEEIRERLDNPHAYDYEDEEEPEILQDPEPSKQATERAATSSTKQGARPLTLFKGRPSPSTDAPAISTTRVERTGGLTQHSTNAQVVEDTAPPASMAPRRDPVLVKRVAIAAALDEEDRRKRRFIDPQPDGERIIDDILPSQSQSQGGLRQPGTQGQVLGTQDMVDPDLMRDRVDSPSEDEGFQEDARVIPNVRPRPRISTAPARAPTQEESTQPERRRRVRHEESLNRRPRTNPGQLLEPFQSTNDVDADTVRLASLETRREVQKATFAKTQRPRNPWTDAEIGALMRYIRDYGISWASIKRIDEGPDGEKVLEVRSAEDIRFKAREIKVKFLCSSRELPANFNKVALGKKEIEKVNRHVTYVQAPQRSRARINTPSPPRSLEKSAEEIAEE